MIRFFAAHPTAANLLMMAFLAAGFYAAPTLQKETFPRVDPRRVQISVAYPGARPEDIETSICRRIEDRVNGVDNVAKVQCEARENLGLAVIEMVEGRDLDRFFSDIKTEVEAIDDFPEKVKKPVLEQIGATDFVTDVALTGPDNPTDLKAYAEQLKTRMLQWGGIPKVEITGFSDHQIRIELDGFKLRQFGLSINDVATVISRQSVDLPAGSVQTHDGDILIRLNEERKRVYDFFSLVVVSSAQGGEVRLGDIAQITDRFDLDEEKIFFNDKRAAVLKITKTQNEDTLKVIDAVKAFVENERLSAPALIALTITNDASSVVRDRLALLVTNGVQGLVLVFAAMLLFFGMRYSFWIVVGLPVSFMGAVAMMVIFGYSLNMLTMVALLIVIGLLMDDAIVIAENIASHREKGSPPLEAAVNGSLQVLPGVFASFATTVCIFGSLAFLKGDIGAILKVVPIVMLAVLVISLIEAFFILPAHLHHSLMHASTEKTFSQRHTDVFLEWMRERVVGRFADWTVSWRYFTVGVTIALFLLAISAMAGGLLKFSAFPDIEGDSIEARLLLPQGTPLARTKGVVAKLDKALQRLDENLRKNEVGEQSLLKNVAILFNENKDAFEKGRHVATIRADLRASETRRARNDEILALWRKESGQIADVLALKFTNGKAGPGGIPLDMRLKGEDLSALKKASIEFQSWLGRYEGVADVVDDLRPGKPEYAVRLKPGALQIGVDARMVGDQLRTAFFGTTINEIQVGGESYEIDVRLQQRDRDSLADLDYFTVITKAGDRVPLTTVATLERDRGYARINRVNGIRTVTITGELDTRIANANEIIADIKKRFLPEFLKRHPTVSFTVEGKDKEAGTTQRSMVSGFMLGIVGVFLLLSFQFRSYIEPLVVMIVIPLAFIGAVAGHIIMGIDFTMPSMLGFVALAGIVVNDSILLINFIKDRHGPGTTVAQAAPQAVRARFRAIFLTSLTTIVGLLPILSETSLQAQILIPLVTSLAFGLLASTLLVLFVVPAFYAILDDFGLSTLAKERRAEARKASHL